MLINFTVGNYCSFKEKKTLNMEATSIKELKESVILKNSYRLLPSAAIYGANSSGKSNLLKAFKKFQHTVLNSTKSNSTDKLNIVPFLLNPETKEKPSFFEIELLIEPSAYRYGFTADNNKVFDEWLYQTVEGQKKEKCLFVRTEEGIGVTDNFREGNGLEEKTRDNALFLSVVDMFNGQIAKDVVHAIFTLFIASGTDHESLSELTNTLYQNDKQIRKRIDSFFSTINLGFNSFEIPSEQEIATKVKAYTFHHLYDKDGQIIGDARFNMKEQESAGTNKLFDLSAYIVASLYLGYTLIIDELDSKLHPILTRHIINLFNNPETNTANAQLIFATHDTNLLNIQTFRRDQIWFTEKDKTEATDLYSLIEFKEPDGTKIRNDRSFEKDYMNGRYGAIPYIKR